MTQPITWFEIPALDLPRAKAFYEQVLGIQFKDDTMDGTKLAIFPCDREHATGGCVVQGPGYAPSRDGAVLYVNAGESLDAALSRVPAAGGEITLPKTALPPGMGAYAHIIDSEGNRVGLHSARG